MLWTTLAFLAFTAVLIYRHLHAANASGGGTRCARCKTKIPAGAQRCPKCRVPLQLFEVVNAAVAVDTEEAEDGAMHAVVRSDVCVGCGACVPPCPIDGAIRMEGKLAVVDLTKCIGAGKCAEACPVGAIAIGAGEAQRVEVPLVDATFQTNVPGLYVVGELGGRGLIKNAINEGRLAAESVAEGLERHPTGDVGGRLHDIAVVGSGPAGLSAGLESLRRGLDYVVLEQGTLADTIAKYPRNKLLLAEPVNVPLYGDLWIADASKESLLKAWQTIVAKTGLKVHTEHRVEHIHRKPGYFTLETKQGIFHARRVVLALGRRGTPRKLGVPGEDLPKVYYDIVEMEEFAGKRVVVVGGGDSALESAVGLSNQPNTNVILSYRSDDFKKAKPRNVEKLLEAEKSGKLQVWRSSHVKDVRVSDIDIEFEGKIHTIPNDYLIIRVGGIAPYAFLEKLGIEIVKKDIPLVGSGSE